MTTILPCCESIAKIVKEQKEISNFLDKFKKGELKFEEVQEREDKKKWQSMQDEIENQKVNSIEWLMESIKYFLLIWVKIENQLTKKVEKEIADGKFKYIGDVKEIDGKIAKHGVGMEISKKYQYIGEYKNNKRNGLGMEYYTDRCKRIGYFVEDRLNGFALQVPYRTDINVFKKCDIIDKDFPNYKCRESPTLESLKNTTFYLGTYVDDEPQGIAKIITYYQDKNYEEDTYLFNLKTTRYIGEYHNFKRNGIGYFMSINGNINFSQWKDDKFNGYTEVIGDNSYDYRVIVENKYPASKF